MPKPLPPPLPVSSLEAFCLRVLESGDLTAKLAAPVDAAGDPLPDLPSGQVSLPDRPERGPGLQMGPGGEALPSPARLETIEARRLCLSRFAHHELQAVEYFAWALLRWPDAPPELRRGLLAALTDEQRHCRLYLDRLSELGGRFDTDDHSDYFWQQAPAIAASPAGLRAFLSGMGLTLEQANLDFTLTYRDGFAAVGDEKSAALCQLVHDDEVAHVALAARWLTRLSETEAGNGDGHSDLELYLETVPFPLGPARAKGRRFASEPRKRAGLSDAFIEHVREARVQERTARPIEILPNLGSEEGRSELAYHDQPAVRTAARLYALIFSRHARLVLPPRAGHGKPRIVPQSECWPPDLGRPPSTPIFDFLDPDRDADPGSDLEPHARAFAWLNTAEAEASLGGPLAGAAKEVVARLHDKAFAARARETLGLIPRNLAPLVEIIEPEALRDPETLIPRLEALLDEWPDWTGRRYTLKPRLGSSGRGRVGGQGTLSKENVRGAFSRLADRGGAIFEPWLSRTVDLSVTLHVPAAAEHEAPIRILGSLELLASASGVYRGHAGEVDSRGRVFSGDVDDEALRADAASVASLARGEGFSGPCGVDAFRYLQPDGSRGVPRLLRLVEFNARATMGLVAIGLVKRALPRVRKRLELRPGDRHGFALAYHAAEDGEWRKRIYSAVGNDAAIIDLASASEPGDPQAYLVFARDPDAIRRARESVFDAAGLLGSRA